MIKYSHISLLRKFVQTMVKNKNNNISFIKTFNRNQFISNLFLGFTLAIHNGKQFIPVVITEKKLGLKLGDFSLSRKKAKHKTKDKKIKGKK